MAWTWEPRLPYVWDMWHCLIIQYTDSFPPIPSILEEFDSFDAIDPPPPNYTAMILMLTRPRDKE